MYPLRAVITAISGAFGGDALDITWLVIARRTRLNMTSVVLVWRNTVHVIIHHEAAPRRTNVPVPLQIFALQDPVMFAHIPASKIPVPSESCAVRMGSASHLARLFVLVAQSYSPNI